MTRKDFEAIANVINSLKPLESESPQRLAFWGEMARAFADMCAAQNPRFARDRFLTACNKGI